MQGIEQPQPHCDAADTARRTQRHVKLGDGRSVGAPPSREVAGCVMSAAARIMVGCGLGPASCVLRGTRTERPGRDGQPPHGPE